MDCVFFLRPKEPANLFFFPLPHALAPAAVQWRQGESVANKRVHAHAFSWWPYTASSGVAAKVPLIKKLHATKGPLPSLTHPLLVGRLAFTW